MLVDKDLSDLVAQVYFTVLDKLCAEHFHTALDIGWNSKHTSICLLLLHTVVISVHVIRKC